MVTTNKKMLISQNFTVNSQTTSLSKFKQLLREVFMKH